MRRLAGLAALLGAGLAALAVQAAEPAGAAARRQAASSAPRLEYTKFTLGNGLEVILHEDHRLPLVAVNLWYHVGPANETVGRTGFAHLFEHMMFEGSKHVGSKAVIGILERAGASDLNGTTDFDRTNYFETVPSNQLDLALWVESDRMGYLLDGLDGQMLRNQRDVVRNERRQSIEGQPHGLAEEEIFHQLFPQGHPYYASVIGSHADIEAADIGNVREFSREYYTPNNASLAIAGDFDAATIRRQVAKYFASIPAGPKPRATAVATPRIDHERRATVTDTVELPRVYMAWLVDPAFAPGDAEAEINAQILGGGRSSRLYKRLVQEQQLAQDVEVQHQSLKLQSVLTIQATARAGVTPQRLEQAIDAELEGYRRTGPSAAELERARNVIETGRLTTLQRLGGFGGVADTLNRYNQYLKNPGYLPRDLARFDAATVNTVRDIARSRLAPAARVVVYSVPGRKVVHDVARREEPPHQVAESGGRMPEEAWRAQRPGAGAEPRVRLPAPARFTLDNGLTVLLIEQHQLPVVAERLVVLAGTAANPPDRPGLAAFTASLLQEGTASRSAAQLADDVAQLGAGLETMAERDLATTGLSVLKRNAPGAAAILADVIEHPRFADADLDRVRALHDGELQQESSNPQRAARRVALSVLYGSGHPYGYPDAGTRAANKAFQSAEVRRFWSEFYAPANAALILAGDLSLAEARELAQRQFGAWRGTREQRFMPPQVSFTPGSGVYLLDRPAAPQSAVYAIYPGTVHTDPDYVPLQVLNNVFGGLFASRLNMNLREAHGYTYGAFSAFVTPRAAGLFTAQALIRRDATVAGVREMLSELARIRTDAPTPQELALGRDAFAQSLAARFETADETAQAAAELFEYQLPDDYFARLPDAAAQVTSAQLEALAQRRIDPRALRLVVVGDRAEVEAGLGQLGLGPVVRVDDQGHPRS